MDAQTELPARPGSVRAARVFVAETLAAAGLSELEDSAVLLTSELVTNALVHARTGVLIRVTTGRGKVRVEVTDGSAGDPIARPADPEALSGRGLAIVKAMAEQWGVDPLPTQGKRVWFEVAGSSP